MPSTARSAKAPLPHVRVASPADPASWPSQKAWDDLAHDASTPNPFYERWFLLPALTHLGGVEAVSLLCCESEGALVGILPIVRRRSYYGHPLPHLAAWLHDNAFCGLPLVRCGFEEPFWRALLDWADHHAGSALFLHLPQLPDDDALQAALRTVIRCTGRPAAIVQQSDRALLQSDASPDEYFAAAMSAKKRKELRRQHTRLAELGNLAFERETTSDGISAWIDEYLALEASGWKGRDGSALSQHQANSALFRHALTGSAERGRLERLTLRMDGRAIAMLANFITPPGAYSFKTAYDEAYARYSPGVLLQLENLALLARPEIAWADSCAAADHPMIERIWREKRTMLRLSIAIGGKVRKALAAQIFRAERGIPLTPAPQEI